MKNALHNCVYVVAYHTKTYRLVVDKNSKGTSTFKSESSNAPPGTPLSVTLREAEIAQLF